MENRQSSIGLLLCGILVPKPACVSNIYALKILMTGLNDEHNSGFDMVTQTSLFVFQLTNRYDYPV